MANLEELTKKISELEKRLSVLEDHVNSSSYAEDRELMDGLYRKAEELVLKHHKSSAIFLQKMLMIDYPRALKLLDKLKSNGVI